MSIGENIKKYRKSKKLTQEQLAEKCGLSKNGLWNYENNHREPKPEILRKIATALDVSPMDIMFTELDTVLPLSKAKDPNYLFTGSGKLTDKKNLIIHDIGKVKGMLESDTYDNKDIAKELDSLYELYSKRTSLDILKELIESLNCYDNIDGIDSEELNEMLRKVSDVIELEFFKLNK